MILSFKHRWLEGFFIHDHSSRNVSSQLEPRLFRRLQLLDDARSDLDLRIPPSNHFEKLRGNMSGWCSIRVNDQWRLIFIWDSTKGEASQVYLDKHNYR